MSDPLLSVSYKLERAKAHLDDLEKLIKEYFGLDPYLIERLEDTSTGDLVYLVRVKHEVPLSIALPAGDVVHNLRSVLDHLIWRIVELSGGTPTRSTCFPIRKDNQGIDDAINQALDGANDRAKSLVRRLKPYQGSNDLLWKLHSLDIVDKHRLLIGVGSAYKNVVIQMKMDVPWQDEPVVMPPFALNPADRLFPLDDRNELFRIKAQARESGPNMLDPKFTFEIAFGDGEAVLGEPMVPTLRSIHSYVDRVVKLFVRYAT